MGLKHVVLEQELSSTGKTRWALAGPTGDVTAFRVWQDEIQERLSYETRKAYSIAVAQFIDYMYEAAAFNGEPVTPKRARELVEGYKTLLEKGKNAGAHWLRQIAAALPHQLPLAPSSANQKLTAVYQFLEECKDLFEEVAQAQSGEASTAFNPYTGVLGEVVQSALRGPREYKPNKAPFRWLLPAPHRRRHLRAAFAAAH